MSSGECREMRVNGLTWLGTMFGQSLIAQPFLDGTKDNKVITLHVLCTCSVYQLGYLCFRR